MDLTQILTPLLELVGATALALFGYAVTMATTYMKTWLQRQTVLGAVHTAAGLVNLALAKGEISIDQVNPLGSAVVAAARKALDSVPTAAGALDVSMDTAARMVASRVGHAMTPALTPAELPVPGTLPSFATTRAGPPRPVG